jgi:NADPH:quinone reductase-like Zn-dependent oxidoreductase
MIYRIILQIVKHPVNPVRTSCFLVEVTTSRLNKIADVIDSGKLSTQVGTVLSLDQAQAAHEMLGGAPHKRGKIGFGAFDRSEFFGQV